jgi:hypothetical protein
MTEKLFFYSMQKQANQEKKLQGEKDDFFITGC